MRQTMVGRVRTHRVSLTAVVKVLAPVASRVCSTMPELRRVTGGWQIEGTPLMMTSSYHGWAICCHTSVFVSRLGDIDMFSAWLERNGFADARFRIRDDAVRAARAAMAVDPLATDERSMLVRCGAGEYRTEDGRWRVRRSAAFNRWEILTSDPGQPDEKASVARTLHEATLIIPALRRHRASGS